jgi:hypothetical protein
MKKPILSWNSKGLNRERVREDPGSVDRRSWSIKINPMATAHWLERNHRRASRIRIGGEGKRESIAEAMEFRIPTKNSE